MQEKIGSKRTSTEVSLGRCLVDGDEFAKSGAFQRRRKALGLSISIEVVTLAIVIVAPLMTSIAQPNYAVREFVPFVFGGSRVQATAQRLTSAKHNPHSFGDSRLKFPTYNAPRRAPQSAEESGGSSDSESNLLGGQSDLFGMSSLGVPITGPVAPTPAETKKPEEKRPVKISEPVLQAQLISHLEPRYPPLALQTRHEGTVLLHAIINRGGRISALEVVSGSPLFVHAALDAVRQWRYRPTMLNGEPVEVDTSITIIFRLNR